MHEISFHRPYLSGNEVIHVARAVEENIGRNGKYSRRCSEFFEQQLSAARVMMTSSCTSALELAGKLCGLGPGDEAIVPSYTYVSTANAICSTGAQPVFVDIRPDTLNLDETLIEEAITPRTRAIFPVHYAGVSCEMDDVRQIANDHHLMIVEDAAQGVNARYRDRPLGTTGDLATFSFHATKNYTCGEGGALVINSPELIERAEILYENGTDRASFFRGEIEKYQWVDLGSSYALGEISSAFLWGQLESLDTANAVRAQVHARYCEGLAHLARRGDLSLPTIPSCCRSNFHIFYLLAANHQVRDQLMEHLKQQGIQTSFHYSPLHSSPMGKRYGATPRPLPVTEDISSRLLRLPIYESLTIAEQSRIIDNIVTFFRRANIVSSSQELRRAA